MSKHRIGVLLVGFIVIALAATGCKQQQTAAEATDATPEAAVYTGALRADYADALDVTSQLALGVLRLEDTPNAMTAEQAVQALPLWKTLQGATITTQAEKLALTKQLEGMLSAAQVAAVTSMRLTNADAQAWLQEQGPLAGAQGGQMPAGGAGFSGGAAGPTMSEADRAAMRERFENMTAEERANMQAQFGQGGRGATSGAPSGAPTGAGATGRLATFLTRAVVALLTERSGQAPAAVVQPVEATTTSPASPAESAATATPSATATPVTRITLVPWSTPEPKATPTPEASTNAPTAAATAQAQTTAQAQGALVQKTDTDPGPPLTIEITTNYAEPNPLLEGGLIYKIAGFVHNPTDETYQVTAVQVTFFDADGFRGAFYAFPLRPGQRGIQGEWKWHGAMEAEVSCSVLGPGESCPFTAEIAGQNMASFLVHPDAKVAEWHEAVAVTLGDTKIENTGTRYVHISGTATNPNPYPLKNIVISGLLSDANGQTVSMGTGVVTSLAAGASARFDIYVENKAHTSYQVYARAEQDAR
ncbi:MAG TPA: FxLYD domain-containing protein [Anaerolineae bacterium]|nr:FxLYD domain-containing protein [Anaerolineae bacterium]HQI84332.1 FxLYD domain-containing protein [Anaerolineae bacterium]